MHPAFIGSSDSMQKAYRIIENAAASNAPVMITGETGTGKELAAASIHAKGPRGKREMIILNCAAIPENLLESEIFGHIKGSFTGASSDRDGAARHAHGSTLFLDEITEMPQELQAKLLRFVQTGVYTPVGSTTACISDIRFIAATNRDPAEAIARGFLREDFFYRLSVVPLWLPPLRARGADIITMAIHFLDESSKIENKHFTDIALDAKSALCQHNWPGNVRELENTIRNAVIMNNGPVLTREMLTIPAGNNENFSTSRDPFFFHDPSCIIPFEQIEKSVIRNAVSVCGGNISDAARRLNINPSTIHRKQKEWRLDS